MADIAVIGTGYVGLTTGAYLAHLGHDVVCADVVPEKVDALSRGEMPIHEDGPRRDRGRRHQSRSALRSCSAR